MSLAMETRAEVSTALEKRYQKAPKKVKGEILDYVVEITGWSRKHASAVMRGSVPIPRSNKRGKRKAACL